MNFPVIDLQKLDLCEFDRVCQTWGSFALIGHDLNPADCARVFSLAAQFFTQPLAQKNKIRRSAENAWGFYDAELTKNRRDWKEIIDIGPPATDGPLAGAHPQWPNIDGFQNAIEQLTKDMRHTALDLVSLLGQALACETDLTAPFVSHSSFLRINYYPPCPNPAPADADFVPSKGELGISHHTDAGAVTVLLPDNQPGLQFLHDNTWHTVVPPENALIINIGDIVQVWSNNRYVAPLHRVLANISAPRFSIPYFLNPSYNHDYAPLDTGLAALSPPQYQPINWGEFRQQRSLGDYADFGEEIQIAHYAKAPLCNDQ